MHFIQETFIDCPWCGEVFATTVDTSSGDSEHIEDCAVCCSPIVLRVECQPGHLLSVEASRS